MLHVYFLHAPDFLGFESAIALAQSSPAHADIVRRGLRIKKAGNHIVRIVGCREVAGFLALLPKVETHGRIYFRNEPCPHAKAEAIAEMVALAWKWYRRLVQRGKDVTSFPTALATFAAKAVQSGRRVCGQERAKDVLSPRAQRLRGFTVSKLPDYSTLETNPYSEALADNTQSPVPDQVQFRLDFPEWLQSLTARDRRIIRDMAVGERTQDLAQKHGVSPARISQLRREYSEDWNQFCGEA